jgi:hypothetical protein
VEQKTSCIGVRHTRNLAMGLLTRSMLADFGVAARDEDIAMRAAWKVVLKIEHRIICVIKQEQPFFALSIEGIVLGVPCSFGYRNTSEVCRDGFNRAGVNGKNFQKPS